jgi:hypothetical protein
MDMIEKYLNLRNRNVQRERDRVREVVFNAQQELLSVSEEVYRIAREAEKYKIVLIDPKEFDALEDSLKPVEG